MCMRLLGALCSRQEPQASVYGVNRSPGRRGYALLLSCQFAASLERQQLQASTVTHPPHHPLPFSSPQTRSDPNAVACLDTCSRPRGFPSKTITQEVQRYRSHLDLDCSCFEL